MDESRIKRLKSSFKVSMSLDGIIRDTILGIAGGWFVGSQIDLPQVGAVLGGIGAAIKISFDPSALKPVKLPLELKDYAYLYHVDKLNK
jgi:hypothetical protein